MSNTPIDEVGIRKLAKNYITHIAISISFIVVFFVIFTLTFTTGSFAFLLILVPVLPLGIVFYLRMLKARNKFYNKIDIHIPVNQNPQ